MYINETRVGGNLGSDAELGSTPNGTPKVTFSVAVNRPFTSGGTDRKETYWFRCVWYGATAEKMAQYLTKGIPVYVAGENHLWKATDKETGQQRERYEIVVRNLQLLPRGGGRENNGPTTANDDSFSFDDDNDVPF